jgi:hypothetical protein
MSRVGKFAIGLGVASGALLTAWLLTGDRKQKTRAFISKKTVTMKNALKSEKLLFDDSEVHYI